MKIIASTEHLDYIGGKLSSEEETCILQTINDSKSKIYGH